MAGEKNKPPTRSPQGAFSSAKRAGGDRSRRPSAQSIPRGLISNAPEAPDEPVLDDIAANESLREDESGTEGHDAWSAHSSSGTGGSTIPPPRSGEVERLRELSAQRISDVPGDADAAGALDLVDHSRPSRELDLHGEMQDCYALDDLTGALRFADLILGRDPDNVEARTVAEDCRVRLRSLYTSKIGDMTRVVEVALSEAELRWLGLDHRSGFLLSRVDGEASVDELLDICGMPTLEALKTLTELVDRGAIKLRER